MKQPIFRVELFLFILFIFFLKIYLFIYFIISFWPCWVFVAVQGLCLDAVSRGWGLLFVAALGLLILVASLVVEHGL